jgi:hypothetical protein
MPREGRVKEALAALARWAYRELLEKLITPDGGVGIVHEFEPGNAVEEERMEQAIRLKALCDEAVTNPAWVEHDITGDGKTETFCNRAARFIAEGMGCFRFRHDQSANQMLRAMAADPENWLAEDDLARLSKAACRGALAFVGIEDEPHGHINAVAPLPMEQSGTWGRPVPMVAQVGTARVGNGVKKLSAAYRLEHAPLLRGFIYRPSIA